MRKLAAVAAMVLLVAGCDSGRGSAAPSVGASTGVSVDGSFDIGGRSLAMRCQGTGTPTVVYLHGFVEDAAGGGAANAGQIPELLAGQARVCSYDRANVGASGASDGRQTGMDSVRDLHALLAAADVKPPYMLLGASFGGLLAILYAGTHAADVQGMVLLDASLPDDLDLERQLVGAANVLPGRAWQDTLERIDQEATYKEAQALKNQLPAIPVTYLAPKTIELPASYPADKLVPAIRQSRQNFVRQFSPGRVVLVDAPHYMEPEIPSQIADEVRGVIAAG